MVQRYLRSYVSYQQSDWSNLLPFAEVAYNNAVHCSSGLTPFHIVMGKEFHAIPELEAQTQEQMSPSEWADKIREVWPHVKQSLQKATDEYKQQADKRRGEFQPFQVGDRVYLSTKYVKLRLLCKKLGPKYLGPFTITKVINPVTVMLKLPPLLGKIHPVFHCSLLKLAGNPEAVEPPGPMNGDHYEIDEILDSKMARGKVKYLVRWKGYPYEEASWVYPHSINALRLLRRFHKQYPHKPGGGVPHNG